ncbi:MAG: PIN domain-containing protein [Candidatus Lokiarchaeota archaeon]|nr:PIN domain-containing protein [Candidatus Lokiarchaeota archaeon]
MSAPARTSQKFLLDNNVFIAAIKNPLKTSSTLKLIVNCIKDDSIELVGNEYIIEEMQKYQEVYASPSASLLLSMLIAKTKIVATRDESVLKCKPYFPVEEIIDILHAATALQENATIITNDKHFEGIKRKSLVQVWSITDAINKIRST